MICALAIVSLLVVTVDARLPIIPLKVHALAWEHEGRIKLAVANTSSFPEEFTVGFGYYMLGQRVIEEVTIDVPPKTILVTTQPAVRGDSQSGYQAADLIFVSSASGKRLATAQIIGIHPATKHYRVDRYLVPAGQEAIAYLETPDPGFGIDTKVYLSIGKTYELGNHIGKLVVDKVYQGGLAKERKPPLGETENPQDYHNYSYGWRGLAIKAATPRLSGVERLDFRIEKLISTPEGIVRHGLSAPPILVYGPDMTLVEE
jgi:hypothetical protein